MDCPELYIRNNGLQRRDTKDILNTYIKKMDWKPNEIILDIGCGPGDVNSDILNPFLRNKIKLLVGVDKSNQMVKYAKKNYGCLELDFKVLDVENTNDCISYANSFNKVFSFYCFHWIHNKFDALKNINLMLKSGGEVLIHYLLINPVTELYKCMDTEWQKYIKEITKEPKNMCSQDEVKAIFIKAGFRVVNIESNLRNYAFPDFSSLLSAIKAVDDMYNILPPQLHDRYSSHIRDKLYEKQMVTICPTTGKTTKSYLPITIHAIKD